MSLGLSVCPPSVHQLFVLQTFTHVNSAKTRINLRNIKLDKNSSMGSQTSITASKNIIQNKSVRKHQYSIKMFLHEEKRDVFIYAAEVLRFELKRKHSGYKQLTAQTEQPSGASAPLCVQQSCDHSKRVCSVMEG